MATVDGIEDKNSHAPPISDTNLDDAGELDYEPSEPSADSIKEAVSEDEEGEAGDSEREEQSRPWPANNKTQSREDDEGVLSCKEGKSGSVDGDEFSEPEEGEVDELEEGEVKDESDGESKHENEDHDEKKAKESAKGQNKQRVDMPQEPKRRIPITAPPPPSGVVIDARSKITPSAGDARPEDAGVCKFYLRGQCTWGSFCKFLHPASDQGPPPLAGDKPGRPLDVSHGYQQAAAAPVPLMAVKTDLPIRSVSSGRNGSPRPPETAWERGVKQARERIKKATEKKEIDPDFERKRLTMPIAPIAISDETPSPLIKEPGFRSSGPRQLMEFGHGNERLSLVSATQRGSDDFSSVSKVGYERRQPSSIHRSSRDSVDDVFPHQQVQPPSRPGGTYNRSYGNERRDPMPARSPPVPISRERQHYPRDEYAPAPLISNQSPQGVTSSHSLSTPYYHQRRSVTSEGEYGSHQDGRRLGDRDNKDAQRRRLESEAQGWSFRRSPPAYYRDRGADYERSQEPARRNYSADRGFQGAEPPQQHQGFRDRGGPVEGKHNQAQYRPPNYHYYRTLQQQQQRDKPRTGGPAGEHNRDRGEQEKERAYGKGARNDYNYHYYNTKEQQQRRSQTDTRPLPYDRPSYSRQEHHSQWRDPWRRSPSPTGRHGGGGGKAGKRGKGSASPNDDRSATGSPGGGAVDFEKQPRRRSASSSDSRSTNSSKSKSSADSGWSKGRQERNTKQKSSPVGPARRQSGSDRRDSAARTSSRNSDHHRSDQRQLSGSPLRGKYERGKRARSRERSSSQAGKISGKRGSNDVASRAAAKALTDHSGRGHSPLGDSSPHRYRRTSSGHSSIGSQQRDVESKRRTSHSRSPDASGETAPAKPLSPPPPAPFLASTAGQISRKTTENVRPSQQRSGENRKPIKMTIMNKSKVRTNVYEAPHDSTGSAGAMFNADEDLIEDLIEKPFNTSASRGDSQSSPSHSDGSPSRKKAKVDQESGSGGESGKVVNRREELLRQLRAVESAIDAKRKRDKEKN